MGEIGWMAWSRINLIGTRVEELIMFIGMMQQEGVPRTEGGRGKGGGAGREKQAKQSFIASQALT